MATNVASPPSTLEDDPHLRRMRRFVAGHPLCAELRPHWNRWIRSADYLPDLVCADDGALRGTAYRDLGDITPYLWLAGEIDAIHIVHRDARDRVRDGLLADGDIVRAFDNHDFVLSLYLLAELDGGTQWRENFLTACRSLAAKFFATADPPATFNLRACRPGRRISAFGLGLLELFCYAHGLAPGEGWLALCDGVIAEQLRRLRSRKVRLVPRVGLRGLGRSFHDARPNRVFARLFKDNSNFLFALIQRCAFPDAGNAIELASLLWQEIETRFAGFDDGWVRTEVSFDPMHRPVTGSPMLVGNAVACALIGEMSRSAPLAHLAGPAAAESVIHVPGRALMETGFVPMEPHSAYQHLDVMVDFIAAAFLHLAGQGRVEEASALVSAAIESLGRHATPFGYATLALPDGPVGDVCVKYNFLVLKLLACAWLAEEGDRVPVPVRHAIADRFLIDR